MKTENKKLMQMARESLKGNWGIAIAGFLIYFLLTSAPHMDSRVAPPFIVAIAGIGSLFIAGPLALGISIYTLSISRKQEIKLGQIFRGFKIYWKATGTYLLMLLFTLLWTLLLIVPGIIAAISYSMTFYILADDHSIGANEAIDMSKKMMYGYKWKYFCLCLRFLGWFLLCILTLGVGFLWLFPYIQVSIAKFYDNIKDNQINKNQ
jgi:uncharacterized membrane protein